MKLIIVEDDGTTTEYEKFFAYADEGDGRARFSSACNANLMVNGARAALESVKNNCGRLALEMIIPKLVAGLLPEMHAELLGIVSDLCADKDNGGAN